MISRASMSWLLICYGLFGEARLEEEWRRLQAELEARLERERRERERRRLEETLSSVACVVFG